MSLSPRFSLASLILTLTVAALVVALVVTNARRKAEVDELQSLRDMVGQLTISDPAEVHAIGVPTVGALRWQWRLYLPEDRDHQYHLVTGNVPRTGVPPNLGTPQVRSGFPRSGELLLTVAVEKDRNGEWVFAGSVPGRDFSHPIEHPEWVGAKAHSIASVEPGQTVSTKAGAPLVLLRVQVDGSEGDGLMVFIDEFKN